MKVPDWMLERYALGELPAARLAEIDAELARDPALRARLTALRDSDEAHLAARPPALVAGQIRARLAPNPAMNRAFVWALPVALVAGALLLARPGAAPSAPRTDEAVLLKGIAPQLVVHRAAGAQDQRLAPGESARPGDLLQLEVVAAGRPHGVVVSIDGRGGVTLHYPESGGTTALPAGTAALPSAFELDDAPRFERFFLVTSDAPIDVAAVVAAARARAASPDAREGALQLAAGQEQTSFLVSKATP